MTPIIPAFAATAALMAAIFILLYMPRKWWTHVTGHSIMATKVGILLLGVGQVLTYFDVDGGRSLMAAAWLHIALVLLWRITLLATAKPITDGELMDEDESTDPNDPATYKEST